MTRPSLFPTLLLAALLPLVLSLVLTPAANARPTGDLDAEFNEASRYEWGESRRALRVIELAVVEALGDAAAAASVEDRLIALVESPETTAAGRSFACRQLMIIGTGRCVPALTPWLGDPVISHMARRALEVIPAAAARAALAQAAEELDAPLGVAMAHSLDRRDARIEALVTRGGPDDVLRLVDLAGAGGAAAQSALERMRGPGVDDGLAEIAGGDDPKRAAVATRLLGLRGAVERRELLDRLAQADRPAAVRCAALLAVADLYDWRHDPGRVELLSGAMDVAPTAADRRAVLAAIEQRGDPALLGLAQKYMRASDARADAARAVIVLALALEPTDRGSARAALEEIAGDFTDDPDIRARVGEALAQVERNEGYLDEVAVGGPVPEG